MTVKLPINAARKIIDAARLWARSRAKCRRLMDSRSARKQDVERWKNQHVEDTHKLEAAVLELELAIMHLSMPDPLPPAEGTARAKVIRDLQRTKSETLEGTEL